MTDPSFSQWPCFSETEADRARDILLSNRVNYWTGEEGREFELEFARWNGSKRAVALANGTLALEVILQALDIGPGDEVIVTPRTFIASVSCIVSVGATPVFCDIDPDSQNITAEGISAVLTERSRAIICVHLAGWPCEMDAILALANLHGLKVIEDCAQAHGARYRGRAVGSIATAAAWSFCQDKIMTTGGEGGMVTTSSEHLWDRIWSLKDHGKSWDAVYNTEHPEGFRWLHRNFGSNYRMTEIQSAIGRYQLTQMPEWTRLRQHNAARIWETASHHELARVPEIPAHIEHACYKCYIFARPERLRTGWDRDRIMKEIGQRGVPCFSGSCSEVYLEQAFDGHPSRPVQALPVAHQLGKTSLMFLVHPTLSEKALSLTCEVLDEVLTLAAE